METLYHEIPEYPAEMNAATVLARTVDSLGFRYHWASKDLRESDLDFRAGTDGRTIGDTLNHLHFLVKIIENGFTGGVCQLPEQSPGLTYPELRRDTLKLIKSCSDRLKEITEGQLMTLPVKFDLHGTPLEFPYWNLVNGPYCDAHYHVGQIVSMRRAAGNPVDPHVHVFFGKKLEPNMADALRPAQ